MSQELIAKFRGRPYIWRCNLVKDGMDVELVDETGPSPELVLEVHFHFRQSDATSFTAHRPELPLEMVEWFVGVARQALPAKFR